jgi:sugar lactone lactonase YvrE
VILSRISAPGARMLNDVAVDSHGNVFVSDTLGSRIYQMTPKGKVSVFAEGPELGSPNGLAINKNELHVASWGYTQDWNTKTAGKLYILDLKSKAISRATDPLGNLDGLEIGPRGEWLVSDWVAGKVMRVGSQGVEVLGRGFQGSADFGWVAERKLLILPRMKENIVSAYNVR